MAKGQIDLLFSFKKKKNQYVFVLTIESKVENMNEEIKKLTEEINQHSEKNKR